MVSSDPGIDEPLAEWHWFESSKPTFLHRDALGSITAVTGTGAALLYRQAYKAFGERATGAPPAGITPTRLSYTGRENSLGSLYQYRSRYYDSSLGRFLSQDGYRGEDVSPPSLHRYAYVHNNPVRYTDPSGMFGIDFSWQGWFGLILSALGTALILIPAAATWGWVLIVIGAILVIWSMFSSAQTGASGIPAQRKKVMFMLLVRAGAVPSSKPPWDYSLDELHAIARNMGQDKKQNLLSEQEVGIVPTNDELRNRAFFTNEDLESLGLLR
jgi:RHS repeat-associated protein